MSALEYEITYTIRRYRDGSDEPEEIGFGASAQWTTIGAALHEQFVACIHISLHQISFFGCKCAVERDRVAHFIGFHAVIAKSEFLV